MVQQQKPSHHFYLYNPKSFLVIGNLNEFANNDKVIIGTEIGLYQQLKKKYPKKNIVPLSENAVCVNMKKTSLNDVFTVLHDEINEIIIDKDISERALLSLTRMLSV
jgi:quinolinate synthase